MSVVILPQDLLSQENAMAWSMQTDLQDEEFNISAVLNTVKKRTADAPFFTKPFCLNNLKDKKEDDIVIRKLIDEYSSTGVFAIDSSSAMHKKMRAKIHERLLGLKYFLRVKIFATQNQKTISFRLFNAKPGGIVGSDKYLLPELDVLNTRIQSARFSINATEKHIQTEIGNAIKRLFRELDKPPIAVIRINDRDVKEYYHSFGKPFTLNGLFSTDEDTDWNKLKYEWRQIALDGSQNVPHIKRMDLEEFEKKDEEYVFPRIGKYKFGLTVYDGISYSKEDTLTVTCIPPPKIELDKRRLRENPKVSIFQFVIPKNRAIKISDSINIDFHCGLPLNYELNYFEQSEKVSSKFNIGKEKLGLNTYQLNFKGKLAYETEYHYGLYGKADDVYTDTSYYSLKHSKLVFGRIAIGFDLFLGERILCAESAISDIWAVAPTLIQGGIFLFHKRQVSLLFEGGAIIFWRSRFGDRIAGFSDRGTDTFMLGKLSLKIISNSSILPVRRRLDPYFALHLIGGPITNSEGSWVNRRHYGFGFGLSMLDNKLDVDLLNLYWNSSDKCFSLAGGVRFNIYKLDFPGTARPKRTKKPNRK